MMLTAKRHLAARFVLTSPTTKPTTLTLATGADLGGNVTAPTGVDLKNARIVVTPDEVVWALATPGITGWLGEKRSTTCDATGAYRIVGLPAATSLRVTVTHDDVAPASAITRLDTDTANTLDLALAPTGTIKGRVVDGDGKPVACASVRLKMAFDVLQQAERMKENRMPSAVVAVTRDDGRFTFPGCEEGRWTLTVQGDGFENVRTSLSIAGHGTVIEKTIAVARGLVLRGIVTDTQGNPVPGLDVRVNFVNTYLTDENGRFECDRVKPTENSVIVGGRGIHGGVMVNDVAAGATVTLQTRRCGVIRGRLVDSRSGTPVRAVVDAWPRSAPLPGRSIIGGTMNARSEADGSFAIGELDPGVYDLVAVSTKGDRIAVVPNQRVVAGQEVVPDVIRLEQAAWLRVSAKRANHDQLNPLELMIAGAAGVSVHLGDALVTRERAKAEWTKIPVPAGTLRVTLTSVARKPEFPPKTRTVTIAAGQTTDLAFALPALVPARSRN